MLSPTMATANVKMTGMLNWASFLEAVGWKFSHRPGNPATVGVVRWPSAGHTVGYGLRRAKLIPVYLLSTPLAHSANYIILSFAFVGRKVMFAAAVLYPLAGRLRPYATASFQCRLYLHWGPGHPPAERGPSLESIYRVSLTVDLCEGRGRKLAAFIAPLSATVPAQLKNSPLL